MAPRRSGTAAPRRRAAATAAAGRTSVVTRALLRHDVTLRADEHAAQDAQLLDVLTRSCSAELTGAYQQAFG